MGRAFGPDVPRSADRPTAEANGTEPSHVAVGARSRSGRRGSEKPRQAASHVMSLQLQALGKVRYAPRGSAVSYASRQKKRARRKAQQQQVGPHRPLAVSREGYYSRKNHQAEIRVLRRLQSEGGAGKEGHRPEPPNRHPRSDAPGGEVLPISPSTPIRDQREAA